VCNGIETENNSVKRQEKICTLMCVKVEETKRRRKEGKQSQEKERRCRNKEANEIIRKG
jgi:hypothetical protein